MAYLRIGTTTKRQTKNCPTLFRRMTFREVDIKNGKLAYHDRRVKTDANTNASAMPMPMPNTNLPTPKQNPKLEKPQNLGNQWETAISQFPNRLLAGISSADIRPRNEVEISAIQNTFISYIILHNGPYQDTLSIFERCQTKPGTFCFPWFFVWCILFGHCWVNGEWVNWVVGI